MSGNVFGKLFRIATWGESHGPAVGVVVDGCPAGLPLDLDDIQRDLDRRRPGGSAVASARREPDAVMVLSGVFDGRTTGAPICLLVKNEDADPEAYRQLAELFRPGHADYSYYAKYGVRDWRGGGRASARETVGRVAAGAIAKKLLSRLNIEIIGYVRKIGRIEAKTFEAAEIRRNPLRCPDPEAVHDMMQLVAELKELGDSVGSQVAVLVRGVPSGWGEPVFHRANALLAHAFFSIPAVKAVEFGSGIEVVAMRGSDCNDALSAQPAGPRFLSNHAGGTLGGITSGQEITARVSFKPPSSIAVTQQSVNIRGEPVEISVSGRHDPVIGPRAVVVVEAMTALVLADLYLLSKTDRVDYL